MNKTKKRIAGFIVILLLVIIYLFINLPKYREPEVGSFDIAFKKGTTEPEVKAILKNCDMPMNYTMFYNTTSFQDENVGKCIYCVIMFVPSSDNRVSITEKDAIRIKNELEKNNKVLSVHPEYLKY
jgi:hypothetical protein